MTWYRVLELAAELGEALGLGPAEADAAAKDIAEAAAWSAGIDLADIVDAEIVEFYDEEVGR